MLIESLRWRQREPSIHEENSPPVRSENLIRPRAKLKRNDIVVIDNLPAHKVLAYARRSKRAAPHSAICPNTHRI
jgi:hypothetical protein